MAVIFFAAQAALGDEKLRAELKGTIVLRGPGQTVQHAMDGKVTLTARLGKIRKIEVYTEWSGPNEVRQKMTELYLVRGDRFAGWVERFYVDTVEMRFSRTAVHGNLEQDIRAESGSGKIEWTISEAGTFADASGDVDGDGVPDDIDLDIDVPVVNTLEEGDLNLVLKRKIKFEADDGDDIDRPWVILEDSADETVVFNGAEVVRTLDDTIEGRGRGTLAFDEDEAEREAEEDLREAEAAASPSPTPTPTASPTPTPAAIPSPTPFVF